MDIKEVREVAEMALEGTDMFVVECTITPDNTIDIVLDSDTSVSIDFCIDIVQNGCQIPCFCLVQHPVYIKVYLNR